MSQPTIFLSYSRKDEAKKEALLAQAIAQATARAGIAQLSQVSRQMNLIIGASEPLLAILNCRLI